MGHAEPRELTLGAAWVRDEQVRHRFVMEDVPAEWRESSAVAIWFIRLTPDEATELGARLYEMTHELRSREDPPAGAAETLVSVSVLPVLGESASSRREGAPRAGRLPSSWAESSGRSAAGAGSATSATSTSATCRRLLVAGSQDSAAGDGWGGGVARRDLRLRRRVAGAGTDARRRCRTRATTHARWCTGVQSGSWAAASRWETATARTAAGSSTASTAESPRDEKRRPCGAPFFVGGGGSPSVSATPHPGFTPFEGGRSRPGAAREREDEEVQLIDEIVREEGPYEHPAPLT